MTDARIGRQTPTVSVVLPYEETRGGEAVLLYNQSTKKALEWQELMMYDIMAVNGDNTWRHMKFGWSVPRQNGKSELLIMRAIWVNILICLDCLYSIRNNFHIISSL